MSASNVVRQASCRLLLLFVAIHLAVRPALILDISSSNPFNQTMNSRIGAPDFGPLVPLIAHSRTTHRLTFPIKAMIAGNAFGTPENAGSHSLEIAAWRLGSAHCSPPEHPPA